MHDLGRALQQAGLNERSLAELFGPAWTGDDVPLVLERYRADDPRVPLARLFVLGERVAADSLPVPVEELLGAGLVGLDGGGAIAKVRLTAYAGLLVAHDAEPGRPDFVTGVSASSRTLATLTVRRPVRRALDIGTGCGVEALLASRHAREVVATDVNPRALEATALGARLNGISLDLRTGSFFEPVAGERFGLIVANPPFVISPDDEFLYRDSPLPGDAVCREVIRGAVAHLEPGGFATVLCNWICRSPEEQWQPLAGWVEGLDCDALLLAHGIVDPLGYASRWNAPLRPDPKAYAAAVGRWLDYYDQEGITGIGIGSVILRGRDDPGRVRGFSTTWPATGSASDHILRLFAASDRGEGEILDARLGLVRGHRLDQTLIYDDEYRVAGVTMSLAEGVGLTAEIEAEALPLLFELTPERSVREVAEAAEVDPAEVEPTVRRLLEHGLLALGEPPGGEATR